MKCVESDTFSFVLNGAPVGYMVPKRGLHQGDPISPYLFLFVAEGLTSLLRKAEVDGVIWGHSVCQGVPPVSHLLFADDLIFFYNASISQARDVKSIIELYG